MDNDPESSEKSPLAHPGEANTTPADTEQRIQFAVSDRVNLEHSRELSEKEQEQEHPQTQLDTDPAEAGRGIQFAPSVKTDRPKRAISRGGQDLSASTLPIDRRSRSQSISSARGRQVSVHSVPPVFTEKEKDRRRREKEDEERHVNIDEHLMSHADVAARYTTHINLAKPGDSQGLTSAQAEKRLAEHGPNVLTPTKQKHPFIKFLEYLCSLFNLLLILAGVLEYILLGIDFHDNFQNVSFAPFEHMECIG
jgi:sodium/potassium-transporting ATPase subunit alpha